MRNRILRDWMRGHRTVLVLVLMLSSASVATAVSDIWNAGGAVPPNGIWGTGTNWADDTTPGNADTATFNLAGTYTATFNTIPLAIQALTTSADNVTLASSGGARTLPVNSASGGQDVTVNGGATLSLGSSGNPLHLTVGDDLILNNGGTLNVNFGSDVTTIDLLVGNAGADTSGTVVVDGSGSSLNRTGTNNTNLGSNGAVGNLTYRNNATGDIDGQLSVLSSSLASAAGTLNVETGADLQLDSLVLGGSINTTSTGTVTVTGSGSTITQTGASTLTVGRSSGNIGVLNVNSAGSFSTGTGAITVNNTGSINVAGGTLNANGSLTMTSGAGLTINGGTLNANAGLNNSAGGTLNFFHGELVVGGGTFAPNAGSGYTLDGPTGGDFPRLRLTGGTQCYLGGQLTVGGTNRGELTIEGNSYLLAGNGTVAGGVGSFGSVTVRGEGNLNSGSSLVVGNLGTGTLTIQDQASVRTDALSINSSSNVYMNGGSLRFSSINNLSRLSFNSGTVKLPGDRALGGSAGIDPTIFALFGFTIESGKGLAIESGDLTINLSVVVDGGRLDVDENLYIGYDESGSFGELGYLDVINGGKVTCSSAYIGFNWEDEFSPDDFGEVLVSGADSEWNIGGILVVGRDLSGLEPVTTSSTLTIENQALVSIGGGLTIVEQSIVTLSGGTLRMDTLNRNNFDGEPTGDFIFNSGTIELWGDRNLNTDPTVLELFGAVIPAGKNLTVVDTATLFEAVTIGGGILSVGQLASASELQLLRGTLNVTNQALTIESGGVLGDTLDVNDDMTVNVTLGITNQGLVTGDGQIGGTFTNAAVGELRGEPGRSLKLTGANNTNAGQISLYGGMLEFTQNLTNNAGAFISGNGTLKATTGLINNGTMNFSGLANVVGDVVNSSTGKVISSGGGPTTFLDDVTNQGEIRTSAGSFTVFYGAASGAGTYTGLGTVNFEGDLKPGNSAAAVQFGGDVVFGPDTTLVIEIGGTIAGTQYDQINVAGELSLGGTLEILLINGFTPTAGQTFDFFGGSDIMGSFSALELPSLSGLSWDTSQLLSGVLSVVPGISGDFDVDGDVDGRDFLIWQRGGSPNPLSAGDLADWRANYGTGPLVARGVAVPEPCTLVLLTIGLTILGRSRGDANK